MTILDCSSFDSAARPLADIIGTEPELLIAKLRAFETDEFQYLLPEAMWERMVGGPRELSGIYWFHLTRTIQPDSFKQRGILSWGEMIEPIWGMVFGLIG